MTTQTMEMRIAALENGAKQGGRDISMVSQAMAEVLEWVNQTEITTSVAEGTLAVARDLVLVGHLRTEVLTLEATLRKMGDGTTIAALRKVLTARVEEIRNEIEALAGKGP